MNISTTAKLVGVITARTSPADRRQSWKAEARAEIAALRMVTV